ncbi:MULTISPECIES: hypothetical protein [Bacteria]|uniref:hypothetical protein n=1 Tax=Bacteria TaxID=2 RepID=UPI003C7DFE35
MRVVFAGLAHSHPFSDAENIRSLGGEVAGVHDVDPARAEEFAARFGGRVVADVAELPVLRPDLVIATPRPDEAMTVGHALVGRAPVFLNKVAAADETRLREWDALVAGRRDGSAAPLFGTASVLRFAPALTALVADVRGAVVLSVRVLAQHDAASFRLAGRAWQDDPTVGGGTAVTVGIHAWEMVDRILPGAVLGAGTGWTRASALPGARSEDVAGIAAVLHVPGRAEPVPVHAVIGGVPGDDAYALEIVTDRGVRTLGLAAAASGGGAESRADPRRQLGFEGLIRQLAADVPHGRMTAPWAQARTVVANSIRAAALARGGRPA